ncbi:MAG: DNA repair protein RecO [Sedimentisphaerales bacterium]|nr:DNA repair protein RecO [Sedimentisphaerales bacterium]
MLTKDQAICIRAVDYSETSQIVTFFTKASGKIDAIAKGSKRPKSAFDGPIEIFSHGKIVFTDTGKEKLATLTEFESGGGGSGFAGLSHDLAVMNCCFFAAELLNKMTHDYDPHPELFESFLQFLQNAADRENKNQISALLILFQLSLLRETGLQPVLSACANCKSQYAKRDTQYELYFSSSANGIICRDCEASFPDKIRLSQAAANCLGNLKLIAEAKEKTLNEIERIFIGHFTELLGHRPKMAKHLLKM